MPGVSAPSQSISIFEKDRGYGLSAAAQYAPLWPLAVYFIAVVLLVGAMLVLSHVLGERRRERLTSVPYESGVVATGSARLHFDVKFYMVAMFFVIFDMEAVFVFAWAVSAREAGWAGYIEMIIFIGILLAALFYLWKLGALEWGTSMKIRRKTEPL
ncbi:MAG: NADH-quinone oxidoreductase subunit A [Deltaproteobacteria bacterium]|nr:NADH-quinone oxidoreductase subunit A [Deltaproteobacteria bacterium]MCL4873769.1 NADH-quinone oxidoreductase subunit A [bacterium]